MGAVFGFVFLVGGILAINRLLQFLWGRALPPRTATLDADDASRRS
jgi:hypothetical protein